MRAEVFWELQFVVRTSINKRFETKWFEPPRLRLPQLLRSDHRLPWRTPGSTTKMGSAPP